MKALGFLCLLMLIGTAMYLGYSSKGGSITTNPGVVSIERNSKALMVKSRKLKDNSVYPPPGDEEDLNLEDYRRIDPVPSSKASIRPGPVQHGTPFMPYIPKPSPPPSTTPKRGG